MVDHLDKLSRSVNMSLIKSKNTKPELFIRSLLHRMGFRFRLHSKALPGNPDIVLKKYKTVVFVHGCFWHQHDGCRKSHLPKSNQNYWAKKLKRNKLRDSRHLKELNKLGWKVIVVWECEISNQSIAKILASNIVD